MKSVILVVGLLGMLSPLGSATTWSGVLVDGNCYTHLRGNAIGTLQFVDRDTEWMIGYCAPSLKTGCFDVVPTDGGTIRLDSQGNARAWALVRRFGKRRLILVDVVGVKKGTDVAVSTMRVTKVLRRSGITFKTVGAASASKF